MAKQKTNSDTKKNKKIAAPSHTKSFYRFSKDFPSVTDSEGFRDNEFIRNSPAKKASLRRRLIALFVCVFTVTYLVTMLGFAVSHLPIKKNTAVTPDGIQASHILGGYNAVYLTGDVLSYSSAEILISEFKMSGVDTVVIDFKDAEGNFYFKPSIGVSNDALFKASDNAASIVKQFRDADIDVFAKMSCFADDIYARNNQDNAAYVMVTPESGSSEQVKTLWYNTGTDSHAWLDPFSNEIMYYLRTVITDVAEMNVDGIIFDHAVLPTAAETDNAVFSGAYGQEKSTAEQMISFINTLNSTYINCVTGITVPSDIIITSISEKKIPSAAFSGCDFIMPDARLSLIPENTILDNMQYKKPSVSPNEFITQYMTSLTTLLAENEEVNNISVFPILETSDSTLVQISAVSASGGNSYMLYNTNMDYRILNK